MKKYLQHALYSSPLNFWNIEAFILKNVAKLPPRTCYCLSLNKCYHLFKPCVISCSERVCVTFSNSGGICLCKDTLHLFYPNYSVLVTLLIRPDWCGQAEWVTSERNCTPRPWYSQQYPWGHVSYGKQPEQRFTYLLWYLSESPCFMSSHQALMWQLAK